MKSKKTKACISSVVRCIIQSTWCHPLPPHMSVRNSLCSALSSLVHVVRRRNSQHTQDYRICDGSPNP